LEPAIETRGLTRTFGPVRAVDAIDLVVPAGRVFGFLGPNGSDKTTTIRLLLGLLRPTAGEARLLGEPAGPGAAVVARVGALVERPAFYPYLSAAENLLVFGVTAGLAEGPCGSEAPPCWPGLGLPMSAGAAWVVSRPECASAWHSRSLSFASRSSWSWTNPRTGSIRPASWRSAGVCQRRLVRTTLRRARRPRSRAPPSTRAPTLARRCREPDDPRAEEVIPALAEIRVGENETFESALRRFNKKIQQSGILAEARRREHYEKPSVKRKRKEAKRKKAARQQG